MVSYFVLPTSKSSTGENVLRLKLGEEFLQDTITLERWCRITVIEAAVVGGNDLIGRLDHLSVDQTLDGVLEKVGLVNWFHG